MSHPCCRLPGCFGGSEPPARAGSSAVVIVVLAKGHGLVGRALCSRPLVWLGEISFSIYMVHQLLFKILVWRLEVTSEVIVLPVIIVLAALAHHLIERPGQALIAGGWRLRKVGLSSATS